MCFNPSAPKRGQKFTSANLKNVCPSYIILRIQRRDGSDEAAHDELPYLDQHCLQIQLFSVLVL